MIWIRTDRRDSFATLAFEDFLALGQREVKRSPGGRRVTSWFERDGRRYFVKVHHGVGWRELAKNWLQAKAAVVDARPEVQGLERCAALGIPAPRLVAHGNDGGRPATRRSFLVTEALDGCTRLSALSPALPARLRLGLARGLGDLVGRLHGADLMHRDLYLDHVLVRFDVRELSATRAPDLFLLDLHRALSPAEARRPRWLRKDLHALLDSARAWGATASDVQRFVRAYRAAGGDPSVAD